MPKRKRDEMDSLNHIKKKIKKLERKLLKAQRRHSSSSSSDSVELFSEPQVDTITESENAEELIDPGPSTSATGLDSLQFDAIEVTPESAIQSTSPADEEDQQAEELDEVVLQILGSDPSTVSIFGKDIQKDLAIRFEFIATSGLSKEHRKELIEAHLPPANCKLIDAPSLNPEIKAAVNESIVKRDNAMKAKQKQVSCAVSCLSEAITLLLSKETKDPTILKLLIDTGRILCDSQHSDSVTRRNFILAVLKKELKDQIQLTKIDNFLFGQELADTLKAAKAISKSGADLKSAPPPKFTNRPKIPPPKTNRNLNWRTPAPSRRPPGPQRAKEAAPPARQHAPSSRASHHSSSRGRR